MFADHDARKMSLPPPDRNITSDALKSESGSRVSTHTIRCIVRQHWARKWRDLKRPNITKDAPKARLHFSRTWLPKVEELMEVCCVEISPLDKLMYIKVIFSDETSVQS